MSREAATQEHAPFHGNIRGRARSAPWAGTSYDAGGAAALVGKQRRQVEIDIAVSICWQKRPSDLAHPEPAIRNKSELEDEPNMKGVFGCR